jgi:hypothetical protein
MSDDSKKLNALIVALIRIFGFGKAMLERVRDEEYDKVHN